MIVATLFSATVFAGPLELSSEVGFLDSSDKIVGHKILSKDRILIIGKKKIQIWDYRNGKLLNEVPHEIKQFAPKGFVTKYILFSIPVMLDWKPFVVEPDGKWMVTSERVNGSDLRYAVVRDLVTLKTIATLELPGVSAEMIAFDPSSGRRLPIV